MFEKEKKSIIHAGELLDRYGLIALTGGNLSLRLSNGNFLMTPSGMMYGSMDISDLVEIDKDGKVINGHRRVSVDHKALLYIFNNMPAVNAIIHTHQPYATAVGLVEDEIPCNLTTLANATKGTVKVAPYVSAATEEMGIETVKYIGDKLAVILKHHGVIAIGKDLQQALYAAVYLEEAAKTYTIARSMSDHVALLNDNQIKESVEVFNNYGQK